MPEITPIIVQGIARSDPKCFRSLYDAYYAYLCGLAVSYIHDFEQARELVNDVFLRVWEHRTELKHPPLPYLISGVRNKNGSFISTAPPTRMPTGRRRREGR